MHTLMMAESEIPSIGEALFVLKDMNMNKNSLGPCKVLKLIGSQDMDRNGVIRNTN